MFATNLARFLGAFSIGLGTAELLTPRFVGRLSGVGRPFLLRGYGLREIGNGLLILAQPDKSRWIWMRVAGDVIDIVTLGAAAREPQVRTRLLITLAALTPVVLLDLWTARRL